MIEGLKPYAEYRALPLPWLRAVPNHWHVRRAKYLLNVVDVRSEAGAEELLTVSSEHGIVRRSSARVTMFKAESYSGYKLCWPNDLVVNSLWAWGRGLGISEFHGIVSPAYGVYRIRDDSQIEPAYLDRLLRSNAFNWELRVRSQGIWISRLQLTDDALLRAPIIVPPLDEQRAIVRFLEYADRRIRKYIAAKRKLIALLEEQKRAIIQQAVTRGLDPNVRLKDSGVPWIGMVPEHWIIQAVRKLGRVQGGKSLAARALGAQRPYLRVANVFDGRIDARQVHTMPFTDSEFSRFRLHENDILLNEGQSLELVGRTALYEGVSGEYAFQNSLIRVQALPQALPHFLEALFRYAQHSGIFAMIATQTTSIAHLGVNRLADLVFALPPRDEQERIVRHISYQARELDRLRSAEERGIELLREYRRRLISDVVIGKLDVREAAACLPDELEDDPSEVTPLAEAMDVDNPEDEDES